MVDCKIIEFPMERVRTSLLRRTCTKPKDTNNQVRTRSFSPADMMNALERRNLRAQARYFKEQNEQIIDKLMSGDMRIEDAQRRIEEIILEIRRGMI